MNQIIHRERDSRHWLHFRRTRRWYKDASAPHQPRFFALGRPPASSEADHEPSSPSSHCAPYYPAETERPETASQMDIRHTLGDSRRNCERSAEVVSWSLATVFPAALWFCSTDLCLDFGGHVNNDLMPTMHNRQNKIWTERCLIRLNPVKTNSTVPVMLVLSPKNDEWMFYWN